MKLFGKCIKHNWLEVDSKSTNNDWFSKRYRAANNISFLIGCVVFCMSFAGFFALIWWLSSLVFKSTDSLITCRITLGVVSVIFSLAVPINLEKRIDNWNPWMPSWHAVDRICRDCRKLDFGIDRQKKLEADFKAEKDEEKRLEEANKTRDEGLKAEFEKYKKLRSMYHGGEV